MNQHPYRNLLSPIRIGNRILKNRMLSSNSTPHFLQGPERYPADGVMTHYINRAKNGAAIVTVCGINNQLGMPKMPDTIDLSHNLEFDVSDPQCQNYLIQLTEGIHFYNSLASAAIVAAGGNYPWKNADGMTELVNARPDDFMTAKPGEETENKISALLMSPVIDDKVSTEKLEKIAESFAQQAALFKRLGFDMVTLHMAYRAQILGQMFSPVTNHRTDSYGGSFENRCAFPLMVFSKIREATGRDFLIELQFTLEEHDGYSREEGVAFLKQVGDLVDIVQIRCDDLDENHPTGYNLQRMPYLELAAYAKTAGVPQKVATISGYLKADEAEAVLRDNKADLISMARAWISNPEYGRLIQEGRGDDIVPCLRCNKCHGRGPDDAFASVCSVNPILGLESRISNMVNPARRKKKVAIIGGGPAGMRCALYLKERGHEPEIFEASDSLGGAIRHADYVDFKWPLKEFKDYLVYQIDKQKIPVHFGKRVTPDEISELCFDTVVAAVGAEPVLARIPGLEREKVVFQNEVFSQPEKLGKNVVIIGGGEVGVEAGIFLARKGHKTSVVEMNPILAATSTKIHYYSMMEKAWKAEKNFTGITGARILQVTDEAVIYQDTEGNETSLPYDSIVAATGMRAKADEAIAFQNSAQEFYLIGDCVKAATIQQAMRSAYGIASMI